MRAAASKDSGGKAHRKMTGDDIKAVVAELKKWQDKEYGRGLTWERIENFSGFSKPALWAKTEIKSAFQAAKKALADPTRKAAARTREDYATHLEGRLRAALEKVAFYEDLEKQWLARWQRIEYHAQARGMTMEDLDKPMQDVDRK